MDEFLGFATVGNVPDGADPFVPACTAAGAGRRRACVGFAYGDTAGRVIALRKHYRAV